MLAQIRSFAKSPVALFILGLLMLSFLVFGIGDVFRNVSTPNAVVTAGDRTLSAADFKVEFDNAKKGLEQQNQGRPVTTEEAVAAGFDRSLADNLADRESFIALLNKIGLRPGDELVVAELRKIPAFFDRVTGRFDRPTYQRQLQQANMTEAQFESRVRDDVAQTQLVSGLAAGMTVPRTYLATLATFGREARDFTGFTVGPAAAGPPVQPTDAQLTTYIKQNPARFTKPEMRQLSFVQFSPAAIAPTIQVSEADLQKRFEFAKDTLSIPETRSFVQIPVKTAQAGADAAARLRKGEDPAAVAKAMGVDPVAYTDAPKTAVTDRKVADAAYGALKAGEVAGPVQGTLGLAVIKITKVSPGHQATLEEARGKLEGDARREAATEKVYQAVQKYEDARSGGSNVAEAAKAAGMEVRPLGLPISAEGATLDGRRSNIPQKILQEAFSLPETGESQVIDLGQGEYAVVRVDKVLPSALLTLDEARPTVTQIFVIEDLQKKLKAKADELAARVRKGESIAQVAASIGAKPQTVPTLRRDAAGQAYSTDLVAKLFGAKPGETVVGEDTRLGFVVAKLDKIGTEPPAQLAVMVEQQRNNENFRNSMFSDVAQGARYAARTEIKPKVDYARARTAIGLEPEAPAKAAAKK